MENGGEVVVIEEKEDQDQDQDQDRISALPDEIIHQILSFLDMEQAVPTCVLSKRWRYMWAFNPKLFFPLYMERGRSKCSVAVIDHCIKLYKPQKLDTLHIRLDIMSDASKKIEEWIDFAVNREVRVLTVKAVMEDCNSYSYSSLQFQVPDSLFSYQSLQVLVLAGCNLYPLPSHIQCIESLKHLCLQNVKAFDGAMQSLLSKCNRLQTLTLLLESSDLGFNDLKVSIPQLLRFILLCTLESVEIDAPNLQFLECIGRISKRLYINKAPCLQEVVFRFRTEDFPKNLEFWGSTIENISNVKVLHMGHRLFESICAEYDLKGRRIVFSGFRRFHLGFSYCQRMNPHCFSIYSLACFFRCCPFLEEIHIKLLPFLQQFGEQIVVNERSLFSEFGSFFLHHLKLVELTNFSDTPDHVLLVKFLLEKAVLLEKLVLTLTWEATEYHGFLKKIFAFSKASPYATIVVLHTGGVPLKLCFD